MRKRLICESSPLLLQVFPVDSVSFVYRSACFQVELVDATVIFQIPSQFAVLISLFLSTCGTHNPNRESRLRASDKLLLCRIECREPP